MREYGVARATARQALSQLVNWGIAEARKGSGIYVREFKPIFRDGIRRLGDKSWPSGQSIWSADTAGRDLSVDQIEVSETSDVPPYVRDILRLDVDETAIKRSRRYVLDGKPVLISRSWLAASVARGTAIAETDTGPGGIYARLRGLGHGPAHYREELRSRMPGPRETELLAMAPGTPVVEIVRVAYEAEGAAIEINEMTADASAYVFRYEFDA
jgi:GntR family transcriptional regulator